MEVLFAIAIVTLAAGGIGLGLLLGRNPARFGCRAAEGLRVGRCADCPLRQRSEREERT